MAIVQRGPWGGREGGGPWRLQKPPTSIVLVTCDLHSPDGAQRVAGIEVSAGNEVIKQGLPVARNPSKTWTATAGKPISRFACSTVYDPAFETAMVEEITIEDGAGTFSAGSTSDGATTFDYQLREGESVAGLAGHAGAWLNAIGLLVEASTASVQVSLVDFGSGKVVTVDAGGAIDMYPGDKLRWTIDPATQYTFAFEKIEFFNSANETTPVGGWTREHGPTPPNGFFYSFPDVPSTSAIEIEDKEHPATSSCHWYKLTVKDSNGDEWVLDPEVINYSGKD